MNKIYPSKILITVLVFVLTLNLGYSQSGEIQVKFMGNAGLYLTDGKINLYVDFPYESGAYGYMKYDDTVLDSIKENSIMLFTHKHKDHYAKKIVKKYKKEKNLQVYSNWNTRKLKKLNKSIENFSIQAFKTKHKFTFKHFSYLITWNDKKIFISGDTTIPKTIGSFDKLDWAFIPYWLYNYAKDENINIKAENIGIYHLYPNEKVEENLADNITLLTETSKVITITK